MYETVSNCGSSSLKFQLINAETEKVLAKGLCERIGIDGRLTYQPAGGEKEKSDLAMPTHTEAIQFVIDALTNELPQLITNTFIFFFPPEKTLLLLSEGSSHYPLCFF